MAAAREWIALVDADGERIWKLSVSEVRSPVWAGVTSERAWVLYPGSGPENADHASLYAVEVATGTLLARIDVPFAAISRWHVDGDSVWSWSEVEGSLASVIGRWTVSGPGFAPIHLDPTLVCSPPSAPSGSLWLSCHRIDNVAVRVDPGGAVVEDPRGAVVARVVGGGDRRADVQAGREPGVKVQFDATGAVWSAPTGKDPLVREFGERVESVRSDGFVPFAVHDLDGDATLLVDPGGRAELWRGAFVGPSVLSREPLDGGVVYMRNGVVAAWDAEHGAFASVRDYGQGTPMVSADRTSVWVVFRDGTTTVLDAHLVRVGGRDAESADETAAWNGMLKAEKIAGYP